MKVLQVKKFPIYDIFTGIGWLNWSRVLVQQGRLSTISGQAVPLDKQGILKLAKESKQINLHAIKL